LIIPDKNLPLFPHKVGEERFGPLFHESNMRMRGFDFIAGVDEVGRGPLAGPVVAAAVIMPEGIILPGVKDSKKMTEKAREDAFSVINKTAVAIGIGVISPEIIDKSNILIAALEAMRLAVSALDPAPDFILVDGTHKIPLTIPQHCIIKGDQLCHCISAASVIAKVYRDRIMCSYDTTFPEYHFKQNKGYGTRLHLSALRQYGHSPVHRLTFRGVS
jgi:ribonuclease HII